MLNITPDDDPRMTGAAPRDDDNGINNSRRVARANYTGTEREFNEFGRAVDFCLSIHANAIGSGDDFLGDPAVSSAAGIETLYQPATRPTSSISREYADIVQTKLAEIGRVYGQRERANRIFASSASALLTGTNMPTVLTESGFMTNFSDAILLMDDGYRRKTVEAMSDAVDEIFELWRSRR